MDTDNGPGTSGAYCPAPLTVLTLNCRGLNIPERRTNILWELKKNRISVALLQETHFRKDAAPKLHNKSYPTNYFCNHPTAWKAGVAILITADLEFQKFDSLLDPQGRFLFLKGTIAGMLYTFATAYVPNKTQAHFLRGTLNKSNCFSEGTLVWARRQLKDLLTKRYLRSLQHSNGFFYAHANKGGEYLVRLLKGNAPRMQFHNLCLSSGTMMTFPDEIVGEFRKYYHSLYNIHVTDGNDDSDAEEARTRDYLQESITRTISPDMAEMLDTLISVEELLDLRVLTIENVCIDKTQFLYTQNLNKTKSLDINYSPVGETIAQLTDMSIVERPDPNGQVTIFTDKTGVVKAARLLLSSVTKVLILADRIVVKQIITSRNKVLTTMEHLEKVSSFQEFVQIFSQFGNEMVEFAHLTGDRQNDLKNEKKKACMAAARAVLEKCTMMLLTASKTCLRHPDCESARINKEGVFQRMRLALEQVIEIVTDSRPNGEAEIAPVSIYTGIREFKSKVEGLRENLYYLSKENVSTLLEVILEHTEDFTDSAYTSHENRERILELCNQAKTELEQLVSAWMQAQNHKTKDVMEDLELAILKTCQCITELKRELHNAATVLAADLLKFHADHMVLKALKIAGVEGNLEAVAEYTCKLSEQKEQLVETCRLLRHVSGTEPLEITCIHAEDTFQVTGPQIVSAAETLALHPTSKIAKENLDVFCEAWESQMSDMSILLREINDVFEGRRGEKRAYLSLPRPGKHSGNLKTLKPAKLDVEEQGKIAKLGLELRLLTSDVDSETEKWEDQDNEVVRNGQTMSSMAYTMYLFTRYVIFMMVTLPCSILHLL
ncbi:Alpha-catulin [Pelobates cultripes]|uniref:Alpha-catulin n=1 Tax=Pelobates cultripes TaxID=61616 RepID=A0AAD1W2A0_PELCU|nr:Alpha-catulin [Pelobates cultripes]